MTTGTMNETTHISRGIWKGKPVWVRGDQPCGIEGHDLEVVHHTDEEGRHWCPTGALLCYSCGGVAEEPPPYECGLSGVKP